MNKRQKLNDRILNSNLDQCGSYQAHAALVQLVGITVLSSDMRVSPSRRRIGGSSSAKVKARQ